MAVTSRRQCHRGKGCGELGRGEKTAGNLQGRGSTGSVSAHARILLPPLGHWERNVGSAHPGNGEQSCAWLSLGVHAHSRLLTSRATAGVLPVPEVTQVAPMAALGHGKAHLGTGVISPLPKHQALGAAGNTGDCPQAPLVPGKWHSSHPDPGLTPSRPCSATATGPHCSGGKTNSPGSRWVMERGTPQHQTE